jgi:competence protein ComEA
MRHDRRVAGALLACLAVAAGLAWWRAGASGSSAPPPPVPHNVASAPASVARTTTSRATRLVVDVVGAVAKPGIVELHTGARVVDAIAAAGGATPAADVAQLNLAAPVSDGTRIAVPVIGETVPADPGGAPNRVPNTATTIVAGPVDLNTATVEQLDALPGIGPATAAAIVQDREANGPFTSVDDLTRVRGIGPAKLAQLHDLVGT